VKLLAMDTATGRQSLALMEGELVLARADEEARGSHARWLVPGIDRLLAEAGLALRDLDGLALSIGPGSFTGLRVGLATMLGFRTVTGLPLATVPSLEALAWNVRGATIPVCPLLKARRDQVYWALFRWEGQTLRRLAEDRVGTLEEVARMIDEPLLMVGEGWIEFRERLLDLLGGKATEVREAPAEATAASAVSVGAAALVRFARGETAGPVVTPRYVQRAEAELAKERRAVGAAKGATP